MYDVQVQVLDVRFRRLAVQLSIEGIARLENDGVTLVNFQGRLYSFVPAVVPRPGLLRKRLGWINGNHMLSRHTLPPCSLYPLILYDLIMLTHHLSRQ